MNIPENNEALEHLVIQYLYGDLDAEQLKQFEAELESNSVLQKMLEQEQRFNSSIPIGVQPIIDEDRLQGNRWLLRQTLQKEARPRFSIRQWLHGLTERPFTVAFQGAAMAMTFVLGIMVATPDGISTNLPAVIPVASAEVTPLELVNDEDYEIYQLKVNSYDAMTGDIDLSFSLASETHLAGNVSDQGIHRLMAVALQDDIDSASRLDTINALQPVVTGDEVYGALIHVLQNDQNPGVRYQAVRSLVSLAHEDNVREALRFALSEDVNQGVRIEAFNALVDYRDEETLAVFRQQMDEDSSEYIRAQSRLIVEEVDEADLIL
ncbi:MAG: hypothetical protein GKR91_13340 [Pseudomonadales bacterium]|nr:hypothetical protein [Pseudomonadales bacterium]